MAQDIFGEGRDSHEALLEQLEREKESGPEDAAIAVNRRIKEIRQKKGLSLQDLARISGFSTAMLSQIENHLISPSLGTLIKLAQALEMRMGELIAGPGGRSFTIVRQGEGNVVSRYASRSGVTYGYSYQSLCPELKSRHMEPFLVTLEPSSGTKSPSHHEGEEFIFVLEGAVRITLADLTDVLHPGDSIYYHSTLPHLVECHEDRPALILAVLYSSGT
ncbi:MAG: cupin domain-containing protein [Deltaproteobacteria bacterium]|nr:cupin domain-containing protein [Deltaproteobacteria bacterium]